MSVEIARKVRAGRVRAADITQGELLELVEAAERGAIALSQAERWAREAEAKLALAMTWGAELVERVLSFECQNPNNCSGCFGSGVVGGRWCAQCKGTGVRRHADREPAREPDRERPIVVGSVWRNHGGYLATVAAVTKHDVDTGDNPNGGGPDWFSHGLFRSAHSWVSDPTPVSPSRTIEQRVEALERGAKEAGWWDRGWWEP